MIFRIEKDSDGIQFDFTYEGKNHCGYELNDMNRSMIEVLSDRVLDEVYSWLVTSKGISREEALTTTNNINITFKD